MERRRRRPGRCDTIDDAVRSSLLVNLLTEDNLPYYFRTVESMFGADGAWGEWVRRWTAEEGRHSMAIYGYLMATRAIDPHHLERCRMAQVSGGIAPQPPSLQEGFVYLALQELATRIAHRATGRMIGDPAGYDVMMRVAADENLHQLFYRDLAAAAIEVDPDGMMVGDRGPGQVVRDARHSASRASTSTPSASPRPASTTWPSTTTRSSCPSSCASGTSSTSRV